VPEYTSADFINDAKRLQIPRPKHALDEAREFGGWVVDKLDLLALYLKQYRRVAGNGTYLDGFAGTGKIKVAGVIRPGSARIAIESGAFKHLHFFELPLQAKKLSRFISEVAKPTVATRCHVHSGDFNQQVVPVLQDAAFERAKPCFAFLDPNSTQLNWETVELLAKAKGDDGGGLKTELWVLFNTHQALFRLMPLKPKPDYEKSPEALTLDRVMGSRDAWWDLFERRSKPYMLAMRYAERLYGLGYGATRLHLILDRVSKKPQYYMVHATDHKAAISFMRWAEVETGQERWESPQLFTTS
jgi:three-Cys-motif partner protein